MNDRGGIINAFRRIHHMGIEGPRNVRVRRKDNARERENTRISVVTQNDNMIFITINVLFNAYRQLSGNNSRNLAF